ncbi:MAG TPA: AI-2E family transporter [Gemmatimonadales bacterium]|nr:AI-2E family transporter [Gemmatimonadales bacterium]
MPKRDQSTEPDDRRSLTPDVPAAAFESPDDAAVTSLLEGPDPRTVALVGLFILAVAYTLFFARSFLLPVAVAIFLDFLLSPVVRWLRKVRIIEPVGAALIMVALLGTIGVTIYNLAPSAAEWARRAPESFEQARAKFDAIREPMEEVSRAAEEVEDATDVSADATPQVEIKGPTLAGRIFGGTMSMFTFFTFVVFATYFLLAAGDLFLQKLIKVLPQFRDKKRAVSIAREIESQISQYMLTVTAINIALGFATGFAMKLCGLPNPVLWGVLAGLLNFMPYVGAVITVGIIALASVVSFDTLGQAAIPPLVFFGINMLEGNLITPMIVGNRLSLNTVALFIGMTFWWFVWGIPGALMAVPMMATIKIFCDHFEPLKPVGEFLGR